LEIKSKDIKIVDIDSLVLNPKNNNKHPKEQIERLSKLIKHHGFRNPLVVSNRSGFVLCGHGRIEAAKKAGLKELPVMFQEFKDEAEEYTYLTSDNAIASWAEIDLDMVNSEIKGMEIDLDMLAIKDFEVEVENIPQCDEDEVPEVVHPITRRGDIWLLGNHRLMCGDSTMIDDIEKLMNSEKADMVFTDPPYGIGIDGQKKSVSSNPKHSRKFHEFKGWDSDIPSEDFFQILLGLNIPSVVFGGNYMTEFLPPSRGWIFWGKGQDGQLTSSDGELAWTNINKPLRAVKCNRASIGKSVHPTQKPIEVVEFCLNYQSESGSVLDFFLGSGSTLIACEKTNRKCYGMELDEKYCDVIINRWQNYTGKKATLELTNQTYEQLKDERNGKTTKAS